MATYSKMVSRKYKKRLKNPGRLAVYEIITDINNEGFLLLTVTWDILGKRRSIPAKKQAPLGFLTFSLNSLQPLQNAAY